jgi:hypothetical protein
VIGLLGFAVGGIGLMMGSDLVFWIGVAMVPFALLVLVIMSKMGYGADTRH